MTKWITVILLVLFIAHAIPNLISAASLHETAVIKPELDKLTARADSKLKDRIQLQYTELLRLQNQDQQLDAEIRSIHYMNEETLVIVRKETKGIDEALIHNLEKQVKGAKDRYKPLFTYYQSLNQQMSAAKLLKSKELNALLRPQLDQAKFVVQLARQDIRAKEAALRTAKERTAKRKKQIRDTLEEIDPLHVKIKAVRSSGIYARTQVTSIWNTFKQAVKKGDVDRALSSPNLAVGSMKQVVEHKQKVSGLEKRIADILVRAKGMLHPSK